jgi:hypothetical protein
MAEIRCRFCGAEFHLESELRRHYVETHRIERRPEQAPERNGVSDGPAGGGAAPDRPGQAGGPPRRDGERRSS